MCPPNLILIAAEQRKNGLVLRLLSRLVSTIETDKSDKYPTSTLNKNLMKCISMYSSLEYIKIQTDGLCWLIT